LFIVFFIMRAVNELVHINDIALPVHISEIRGVTCHMDRTLLSAAQH